jgi:4-amino-4-deoxy-L-arabinose transferase-like glycosyltransferase
MSSIRPEYGFFAAMVAGVLLITAVGSYPYWYLNLALLFVPGVVLYLARARHDRAFYLVCSGQPLVVATGVVNLWAGLFVACMLAGMTCGALGILSMKKDYLVLVLFWGCSALGTLILQASNHVMLPLALFGAGIILLIVIQMIRNYQFKKQYSGARL